jgi:hypothetical protein
MPNRQIKGGKMNTAPQIGDFYTTHKSGIEGFVVDMSPNKTGSIRVKLITSDTNNTITYRWTTWVKEAK